MFAIFGLGPAEMLCLAFLAVVVVLAVVLSNRAGRAPAPRRTETDDPLGRIKRDYGTLTDRERRELLQFIQDDLRPAGPPDAKEAGPPVPPEGYRP
jgi:hypothetical protein